MQIVAVDGRGRTFWNEGGKECMAHGTNVRRVGIGAQVEDAEVDPHALFIGHDGQQKGGKYACMIYPTTTGFVWTAQVGGIMMTHPQLEGLILPLPNAQRIHDLLTISHPSQWHSSADCSCYLPDHPNSLALYNKINSHLRELAPIVIIRSKQNKEAWLRVYIAESDDPILTHFVGKEAVLIWENCD
ncbi:MAG TPA: DUF6210 family protein [Ktedonobacteraceae bacterium]